MLRGRRQSLPPPTRAVEEEGKLADATNVTRDSAPPGSSRKSFKSMFPIWISSKPEKELAVAASGGSVPQADAPPKKLRLSEKDNEETMEQQEVFEEDGHAAIKRSESNPTSINKWSRATLAPSEGLAIRGVTREGEEEKRIRLARHASSTGNSSSTSAESNDTSSGGVMMTFANRLARSDIRFVEMKNKLAAVTSQLAAANKRIEELERDNERLNKENKEFRKKLEASNNNGGAQTRMARRASPPSVEEQEGDANTIKIENLEKGMTSRALLQLAESFGGEVTTVRIMRNASTGVLHGYCSFAKPVDALRTVDNLRRNGHAASCIVNSSTPESKANPGMTKRWRN